MVRKTREKETSTHTVGRRGGWRPEISVEVLRACITEPHHTELFRDTQERRQAVLNHRHGARIDEVEHRARARFVHVIQGQFCHTSARCLGRATFDGRLALHLLVSRFSSLASGAVYMRDILYM
jgi:hypothetical protein